MILAIPAVSGVTIPVEDTVATAVLLDVHVTAGFVAFVGTTAAVNVSVAPFARSDSVELLKLMLVTGTTAIAGATVTLHVDVLLPS